MTVNRPCPDEGGQIYGSAMRSVVSSKEMRPVVVGVDGSRNHLAVVDLGAAEAVRRSTPLLLVHVWPGRYLGASRSRNTMPSEEDGRRLLDVAARRAAHVAPDLDIATELVDGSPPIVLVERSAAARLLVVDHRDEVPSRPSWGSTAAYLAHHSACPLLVHRGATSGRGPVVLAASARDGATTTVDCAFQEAALSGARLVAVHVWTRPSGRGADSPAAAIGGYAADRRAAERQLATALAACAESYPDVTVERVVLHDLDIAYTVERASRRGCLLVAGMGRHRRFAELLYGSLGTALVRQASCPVLLIPLGWRDYQADHQPSDDPAIGLSGPGRRPGHPGQSALTRPSDRA
jgi:nucleotide-binding universal stress UspA family protein